MSDRGWLLLLWAALFLLYLYSRHPIRRGGDRRRTLADDFSELLDKVDDRQRFVGPESEMVVIVSRRYERRGRSYLVMVRGEGPTAPPAP